MLAIKQIVARFENVHESGSGFRAACPAHDGKKQTLSISPGRDGRVLIKCFKNCAVEEIMAAASPPLVWADLLPEGERRQREPEPVKYGPAPKLADYCASKHLPVDFVRAQGAVQTDIGILFRRFDFAGKEAPPHQLRVTLDGEFCFVTSPKGKGVALHGEQHLRTWRERGFDYLLICEGATDYLTGVYLGLPIVGLPGATQSKTLKPEHLEGITRLYVLREPDEGGLQFTTGLMARLDELKFTGERFATCFPVEQKDLSDFWIAARTPTDPNEPDSPSAFAKALRELRRPLADVAAEDATELQRIRAERQAKVKAQKNAPRNGADPAGVGHDKRGAKIETPEWADPEPLTP